MTDVKTIDYNPTEQCTTGQRYEAMVPDTLDLADRMKLAINALTNAWYPDKKWALGFSVSFAHRPAVRFVNHALDAYICIRPKFVEALALCRLGSGGRDGLDVDRQVINAQLECLGEDGLTYFPTDVMEELPEYGAETFTETYSEGRRLLALSILSQVDQNPQWANVGRKKIDRLLELTRQKNDFRYFWKGRFHPGQVVPSGASEPYDQPMPIPDGGWRDWEPEGSMTYSVSAIGHGAGLFYRVTGYEPALELSKGLARWALARLFNREDGRNEHWHFHLGMSTLLAVCEYGYAADDRKTLERVDACYRWMRQMGDPLVGFFPEYLPGYETYLQRQGNTVEICEVADMVFLALYLTRAGTGDYWDDVDQWMRNMYAEGQMLSTDFLEKIPESYFRTEPLSKPHMVTDNEAARAVGSFWGWMRANDGLMIEQTEEGPKLQDNSIMHCCTANGARTLYFVWDSIVTQEADEIRVNLLLNRASKWLDVDSYLPVKGKVVLHIKDAPKVSVRIPQWCDPAKVCVSVDGQPRGALIKGRYIQIGWLKPGDEVTLSFPVVARWIPRVIGEIPYKLTLRGSNVVDIEPKGVACPLYQNQPTGKLVKKTRFIPKTSQIVW